MTSERRAKVGEMRVFEGIVRAWIDDDGMEWGEIVEPDRPYGSERWASINPPDALKGLNGKRVRLTIEVFDDPHPAAAKGPADE